MQRFVEFLIRARWPLFAAALALAAAAWWPAKGVQFDRSIEKMFAPTDPLLPPYERLKERFGGNEIVMAVYQDDQLLAADGRGIDRLARVSAQMRKVAGVRDVLSLAEVSTLLAQLERTRQLGGILNLIGRPKETWKGPAILNPHSPLAARFRELFTGYTHSADGRTAAVVCMLDPTFQAATGGSDARQAAIKGLESVVTNLPDGLAPGVLAGEPVMVVEGFALLEADGERLGSSTMILLGVTILIFFRSLRWLVLPLAVVLWALVVTRASLVVSGLQLSMVSSMLTAIVTVVGVATVMHLIVHVREMRTQGLSQRQALLTAAALLAGPILGAIATDVAGFGSLWWASVEPVRDFGTMMVVGSILVIPAIVLLAPVLTLVLAREGRTSPGWGEVQLGYWLMRSVDLLQARPLAVAAVTGAICLAACLGTMRLEVESDFTKNFVDRDAHPTLRRLAELLPGRRTGRTNIVRAYDFVETRLGGAGVWDVIVPAPVRLDATYLDRVRRLQERLRGIALADRPGQPALTKVISLVDAIDSVESEPTLARLTADPEMRYGALALAMPTFMGALRSTQLDAHGAGRLRIMLRAPERQPAEQKRWLINEVTRIAREEFPADEQSAGAEVTGFYVLLTNLIESMLRDQWVTFGIASAGIAAMVFVGFRSWRYALIALIPNAVPIYVVMGLLGWLGLKINMGAAMIAAVSMGMSVDSSIHYYAAFRRARRGGKSVHEALLECQQSVGLAMIFSTIALIVGFGVLITSEFVPTIYFGALMSLAMLGGMLGNLIVLPLLLAWSERE